MKKPIRFSLFAPHNSEAALSAAFTGGEKQPMSKDDQGWFHLDVPLPDGDHSYKFHVRSKSWFFQPDEWVEFTDPRATRVSDDETQNAIVRVKNGERIIDDYVWRHDDTPLPPDNTLVIYELHVADFSGGEADEHSRGRYDHVAEKLDYLCELGVNTIELMPIEEYPGANGWGYNPRHFFAPESSYGPSEALKFLIDECHGRGIRVFKDGVYNHSEQSSPLTQIDHDYWYHHDPQDAELNWGPEFNYEFHDPVLDTFPARRFIGEVLRHWVGEYHFDGLRFDAARQLDNFDAMRWLVGEAKRTAGDKPFYSVAEYLPEEPSVTGVEGPVDGVWHDTFFHTMRRALCGEAPSLEELKDVIDGRRRGFVAAVNLVNYLNNHDHEHLMVELGNAGILGEEAFRRAELGAAVLFTSVGIPMLWMGEEFGAAREKVMTEEKLDWTLLANPENRRLFEVHKALIHLRKSNSAFHGEDLSFFHEDAELSLLAWVRWNGEGARVVTIVNFSDSFLKDHTIPNFPADGRWHEWLRDFDLESADGRMTLDMGPREARVLVHQA